VTELDADKIILSVVNSIKIDFWWFVLKLFVATVILLWVKRILSSVVGYFVFRSSKYISIGSSVEVEGFSGVVLKINLNEVVVENSEQLYIIPMSDARNKKWVINKTKC